MPELRITSRRSSFSHAERTTGRQSHEDRMTRSELGVIAAEELADRCGVDDRIASLLDRAIDVGQEEMKGRVTRALGPFVAETSTRVDDWVENFDMECPMPIKKYLLPSMAAFDKWPQST
jgi:hypothetical protein